MGTKPQTESKPTKLPKHCWTCTSNAREHNPSGFKARMEYAAEFTCEILLACPACAPFAVSTDGIQSSLRAKTSERPCIQMRQSHGQVRTYFSVLACQQLAESPGFWAHGVEAVQGRRDWCRGGATFRGELQTTGLLRLESKLKIKSSPRERSIPAHLNQQLVGKNPPSPHSRWSDSPR